MNLTRCENGHFYDAERFSFCPHCNQGSVETVFQSDDGDPMYTMPVGEVQETVAIDTQPMSVSKPQPQPMPVSKPQPQQSPMPQPMPVPQPQTEMSTSNGLDTLISQLKTEDGGQATIGYFGEMENEPVVGWLVAIEGFHFGEDFRLKTGRNFIGRSPQMDIPLTGDPSISREKHAIILYEPKANMFLVQPGDAKELFYLNDKVVLSATEINAYDILSLGETRLLFIPCCSEKFNWDSVKKEDK